MGNEDFYKALLKKRKGKILLGEGSSRKVYAIDGFVIKRAKNKRGKIECSNENYIYKNSSNMLRPYLCPILYYEEGVVIMPFVNSVNRGYFNTSILNSVLFNSIVNELRVKFDSDDFDIGFDFNWGSVVTNSNNRYVLIDYGHTYLGDDLSGEY